MYILVCGGRHYWDRATVFGVLDALLKKYGTLVIIQGGASGADRHARDWAESYSLECITVHAEWDRFGKAAGFIRNEKMLDHHPNLVVAFPGGSGTANMVALAKQAGVEVKLIH